MSFEANYDQLTQEQKQQVEPYVTDTESHIFALKNLPEVIKGALFSRYSRSYLGLRALLLKEFIQSNDSGFNQEQSSSKIQEEAIQKAQSFYDRILDGYGDDSIGELGGAHLATENVTMLAAKAIEDCRIGGSPLEKSTRYIYFDRKHEGSFPYYKDPVLMQSPFKALYEKTCDDLFNVYSSLNEPLTKYITSVFPKDPTISDAAYQAALRAKVLDCLRGLLPSSTLTNVGVFGNGRFFEKLLSDLSLSDLDEFKSISTKAHTELSKIIPSFIRRSHPSNKHWPATESYRKALRQNMKKISKKAKDLKNPGLQRAEVKLLYSDKDALERVSRTLAFEWSNLSLQELDHFDMHAVIQEIAEARQNRRHKLPRAFEHAFYTFEILADFGAYRDLQRHRMLTQERQILSCDLGYTIPQEIMDAGLKKPYEEALLRAKEAWSQIEKEWPLQAQYIVPMAYRIRWYYHINLRSLQWLCELRSSAAGHSEYRYVAQELCRLTCERHPEFKPLFGYVDFSGHGMGRLDQEQRRIAKQNDHAHVRS